eukprot:TRINITY_DN2523_c0_g6_i1.p1 TRINITY_DN2523_c0_g6~~TRINITY_DN2523_c0_g6_i1.p1  ORF type:complete len:648 (-),score=160.38 TRINITY_DN2523_c0_g6_i1:885-2828(-)
MNQEKHCSNYSCRHKGIPLYSLPFTCQYCKEHSYCSKYCQNEDWREGHDKICEPMLQQRLARIEKACPFITDGTVVLRKGDLRRRVMGQYERVNVEGKTSPVIAAGESQVVLMQDRRSKKKVAVKIVEKSSKSAIIKTLKEKIEIAKSLVHGNIVRVVDLDEDAKCFYIVMEYASKGNLLHYIRTRRKLQEKEAFFYFTQVCNAIHFLDKNNIQYREIRAENLLITATGQIKFSDLGIPEPNHPKESNTMQNLGILLYEMLNGHKPSAHPEFSNIIPEDTKDFISSLLSSDSFYLLELFERPWIKRMQGEFQIRDRVVEESEFIAGDDSVHEESFVSRATEQDCADLKGQEGKSSSAFVAEDSGDVEEGKALGEIKSIKGMKTKAGYATSDTAKSSPESVEELGNYEFEEDEKCSKINEVMKTKGKAKNPELKSTKGTAVIKNNRPVNEVRTPEFVRILSGEKDPERVKEFEDAMYREKLKVLNELKNPSLLDADQIKAEVSRRLLMNSSTPTTRAGSIDSGDYEFQRCETLMKVYKYLDDLEGGAEFEELNKHVKEIEDENKKLAKVCGYGVVDFVPESVQEKSKEFAEVLGNDREEPKDAYKTMSVIIKSMMNLESQKIKDKDHTETNTSSSDNDKSMPVALKSY